MLGDFLASLVGQPWHALRRRRARALFESGRALQAKGELARAQLRYEKSLALDPRDAARWTALGKLLRDRGQLRLACSCYRAAYELDPAAPGSLRRFTGALVEAELADEALAIATDAAARATQSFEAQLSLGYVHLKRHEPEAALACCEAAARLGDGDAELLDLRGAALQELGRLGEALASYEQAADLQPRNPLYAFHRGLVRLLLGDFARGWQDYELRLADAGAVQRPRAAAPWDGTPLAGRTLLVYREQGLGDEIMFASILPELIGAGAHCVVECEPRLAGLFRRSFPAVEVIASRDDRALPERPGGRRIDFEIAAGSLPLHLRRAASAFPRHTGYLDADPTRVARWRERLVALGPGLKVGLSWTGGVRKTRRGLRSLDLARLMPALACPGVRFVSLQYTPEAAAEVARLAEEHGVHIQHWPDAISDYEDTAALACALDLVVSVCTSLVHLCGALGREVWVMAPHSPEWRYGASGDTMAWYPSARMFRQPGFAQWQPVIGAVAAALRERARIMAAT
jgi:tetratricopeptide (TPR) repeat protein